MKTKRILHVPASTVHHVDVETLSWVCFREGHQIVFPFFEVIESPADLLDFKLSLPHFDNTAFEQSYNFIGSDILPDTARFIIDFSQAKTSIFTFFIGDFILSFVIVASLGVLDVVTIGLADK